jgi:hypothetical protein
MTEQELLDRATQLSEDVCQLERDSLDLLMKASAVVERIGHEIDTKKVWEVFNGLDKR